MGICHNSISFSPFTNSLLLCQNGLPVLLSVLSMSSNGYVV